MHRKGARTAEALLLALVPLEQRHQATLLAGCKALGVVRRCFNFRGGWLQELGD